MSIRIIDDIEEAKRTVLLRQPLAESSLSPHVAESIRRIFGRQLTADEVVDEIIGEVQQKGDAGITELARRIDGIDLGSLEVSREQIKDAYNRVPREIVSALEIAAERIADFHCKHIPRSWLDFSDSGGALGQIIRPLERVGLYVPGGTADYPSTILMQAIPARTAGVREVLVASPPRGGATPSELTLVASDIARVDRVFSVGGAQAIAAFAYGTETIPRVDKILGPGNIFVALAKKKLFGVVGIDQIAGPTETIVIADDTAHPGAAAADLLAQAEHDPLASAILVTPSRSFAKAVQREVEERLPGLSRAATIAEALAANCAIVVVDSLDEALDIANTYAPEHLCLLVSDGWSLLGKVRNAGGVFLGEHSPEVIGDYTAGPSHIMPTSGTARFSSPVNVLDFLKVTSLIALDRETAQRLAPTTIALAEAEGLTAHADAMRNRLERPEKQR